MQAKSSYLFYWTAFVGNLLEHYDTALFGLLSPFLATIFFPGHHPVSALLLTYAIIPLGMVARPLGALFFGYIGDSHGRQQALFLSLFGMAIVCALIACMPTYKEIGALAPLLLSLARILQNFLMAGETVGGAIYILESAPEERHDMMSGVYNSSTVGGMILASAGVTILGYFNLIEAGWRFLYLIGCSTALFGGFIRYQMPDSSQFIKKQTRSVAESVKEMAAILWERRATIMFIAVVSGFYYATASIALVLMNGFVPLIAQVTKVQMMSVNTGLLILDMLLLPAFGYLAFFYPREKLMAAAAACAVGLGVPLFMLLEGAHLPMVVIVRFCLVIIGVWFSATFHSWAQSLVPAAHRYAILSFSYAIGSQLLGGPTVVLSLWLYQTTGLVSSAAWYWSFLGLVASVSLIKFSYASERPLLQNLQANLKRADR